MFSSLKLRKETVVGISIPVSCLISPIDGQTDCSSPLGTHNLYIALCDDHSSLSNLFLEEIKVNSRSSQKATQQPTG
jgi:hypothetical protein